MASNARRADVVRDLRFGIFTAEDEKTSLERYFIETSTWRSLVAGHVDVIPGAKGCGKSALYELLLRRWPEKTNAGMIAIPAENPVGESVFNSVITDPPTSTIEFKALWKL